MSNITLAILQSSEITNEITIDSKGRVKISIRGAARLAGISDSSLIRSFQTARKNPSKLVIKLFDRGYTEYDIENWSEAGIPDIALTAILSYYTSQAGKYCTKEAAFVLDFVSTYGTRVSLRDLKGWKEPKVVYQQPQLNTDRPDVYLISDTMHAIFDGTDLDDKLVAGVIANDIGNQYPQLKPSTEYAKKFLTQAIDFEPVTPTRIGQLCQQALLEAGHPAGNKKISAIQINKLLKEKGYQIDNPDYNKSTSGLSRYKSTEKGKLFSKLEVVPGNNSGRTVVQLRWFTSVVQELLPHF